MAEPFLDPEIGYLSQAFDRVFIIATYADKLKEPKRECPANVIAFPLRVNRSTDFAALILGLFTKGPKEQAKHSIRNWIYQKYAAGKVFLIHKRSKKMLSRLDFEPEEQITVYSFWLNFICAAAIKMGQFFASRNHEVLMFSRAHGHDLYWERKKEGFIPFQRQNVEMLDGIFPCSETGRTYLVERYPEAAAKIHTAYLGVEPKAENASSLSSKCFITVSGFRTVKRIPLFARAFSLFLKKHPDWKWVAIGGMSDDGEEVLRIIKENRIADNVILKGHLENDKLMDLYRSERFAYLVNTSYSEGLPYSIIEAFSFSLPSLASNVGGVAEIVHDNINGALFSRDISAEELSKLLCHYAEIRHDEYSALSDSAKQTWSQSFDAQSCYQKWVSILKGGKNAE